MIAQLVGAGALIQLFLGIRLLDCCSFSRRYDDYLCTLGGMAATSWVQIIKAVLLMVGTVLISILVLMEIQL